MADYKQQLANIGFSYDTLTATGYNKIKGICFVVRINPATKDYTIAASCRPQDEQSAEMINGELRKFMAERPKILKTAAFDGKQIIICYQLGFIPDITQGINDAVNTVMYYVNQYGCVPCCSLCGNSAYPDIYSVGSNVSALCTDCFGVFQKNNAVSMMQDDMIMTNYPLGIIGAMLGGLAGAVVWLIFSLLGRISFIAGILAGFGGVFGFKWLGKKITTPGIVLSIIISFIFLAAGMYIAVGIDLYNAIQSWGYDVSFKEALEYLPDLLREDEEVRNAVIFDNIFGVIFFFLSAFLSAWQVKRDGQLKKRAIKLM